jgi:hypothetical protein
VRDPLLSRWRLLLMPSAYPRWNSGRRMLPESIWNKTAASFVMILSSDPVLRPRQPSMLQDAGPALDHR